MRRSNTTAFYTMHMHTQIPWQTGSKCIAWLGMARFLLLHILFRTLSLCLTLSRKANFIVHKNWPCSCSCNGCYSYVLCVHARETESDNWNAIAWNWKTPTENLFSWEQQRERAKERERLGRWLNKHKFVRSPKIIRQTKDMKEASICIILSRTKRNETKKRTQQNTKKPIINVVSNVQQQRRWVCKWNVRWVADRQIYSERINVRWTLAGRFAPIHDGKLNSCIPFMSFSSYCACI